MKLKINYQKHLFIVAFFNAFHAKRAKKKYEKNAKYEQNLR